MLLFCFNFTIGLGAKLVEKKRAAAVEYTIEMYERDYY